MTQSQGGTLWCQITPETKVPQKTHSIRSVVINCPQCYHLSTAIRTPVSDSGGRMPSRRRLDNHRAALKR